MPSVFECLTAMCIIITIPESSVKMLSFNEVEGGPLVSRGDSYIGHGQSGGTGYSGTDGPGGPFIPNTNGPGGPMVGGGDRQ